MTITPKKIRKPTLRQWPQVQTLRNSELPVYDFPVAAITNGHKFNGLRQHKRAHVWSCSRKVETSLPRLKSRCGQSWLFLEASGVDPVPCLFHLPWAVCIPWLHPCIPTPCAFTFVSDNVSLTLLPLSYKDPCGFFMRLTQLVQYNLPSHGPWPNYICRISFAV